MARQTFLLDLGPLFVAFGWAIIATALLIVYLLLHILSRRSPVAAQLKKVMPAFVAAIAIALAIAVVINLLRIFIFQ